MAEKMKKNERQLYWREILNRQAGSGLSVRQFCAKEHVSQPSFYAWRRKLGERTSGGRRSGTSSRQLGKPNNGRDFIPLRLLDGSGALEVIHPLGYRVRVTGDVNVTDLERVLDVLDGRSDG
jgi:hypothetical protein